MDVLHRSLSILVATVVVALPALEARAQSPQPDAQDDGAEDPAKKDARTEARSLYIEGNAHYSAGRYALAAERFVRAYELSGEPALLFNLANTYERAGDYEKAARYLRMYLEGGEVRNIDAVKARLQRLEMAVVELQEKQRDREPAAAQPPKPASPPAAAIDDRDQPDGRPSRVPYVIAGAGLAAGVVASVTFAVLASSERSEIDSLCAESADGLVCPPSADEHLGRERTFALASDIGTGVAVASAAFGLVYYLTRPSEKNAQPAGLSLAPSRTGDGFGAVISGRF